MKFTYLFSTYSLYTWVKFIWQHQSTKCGTPLFGLPDSLWQVFFAEAFNCSGRDPEQKRFSLRTAKAMHICSNPWCTFPTLAKYCFFFFLLLMLWNIQVVCGKLWVGALAKVVFYQKKKKKSLLQKWTLPCPPQCTNKHSCFVAPIIFRSYLAQFSSCFQS